MKAPCGFSLPSVPPSLSAQAVSASRPSPPDAGSCPSAFTGLAKVQEGMYLRKSRQTLEILGGQQRRKWRG